MSSQALGAAPRRSPGSPFGAHITPPYVIAAAGLLVAYSFAVARAPWFAVGASLGTMLLILLLGRPLIVVAGILILGPIDLSFLTGGYKGLFESIGGLDMNGIRLVVVVAGFALMILADSRMRRIAFSPEARWYALLLVFAGLTLAYSISRLDGMRLFFKLAYPFLVFVAVLGTVKTRTQLSRLADLVIVAAAIYVTVINPLYLLFGNAYIDDAAVGFRARGMGLHTGPWSYYLLIVIGMCLVRYSTRRQLRYLLLSAVCGLWVVSTLTRTAAIAAVVALGFLALYSGLARRNVQLTAAAAVVGTGVALLLWTSFVEKTFGGHFPGPMEWLWLLQHPAQYASVVQLSGREVLWAVAYAAFIGSPVIGIGLGSTSLLLQTQFSAEMGHVVHNEYLRLAAETGLIGLSLFLLALIAWWRAARRTAQIDSEFATEWALPAMVAIIVWGVTCLADNSIDYYSPVAQYVGFLSAGAVWVAWSNRREAEAGTAGDAGATAEPQTEPAVT